MPPVHQFVTLQFQDAPYAEQEATMRAIEPHVALCAGFQGREIFYSEEDGRWIDHIVWATLEDAVASRRDIARLPEVIALFDRFASESIVFSFSVRVE